MAVFAVAGALLTWGHNFAGNYVHNELSSQHISFPNAAELNKEGRADLVKFARLQPGQQSANRFLERARVVRIDAGEDVVEARAPGAEVVEQDPHNEGRHRRRAW